jgi:hypothetical protein
MAVDAGGVALVPDDLGVVGGHRVVLDGDRPGGVAVDAIVARVALAARLAAGVEVGGHGPVVEHPQAVVVRVGRLAQRQAGDRGADLGERVARVAGGRDRLLGRDAVDDLEMAAVVAAEAAGEVRVAEVVGIGLRGDLHLGRRRLPVQQLDPVDRVLDLGVLGVGDGRVVDLVERAQLVGLGVRGGLVRVARPQDPHRLALDVRQRGRSGRWTAVVHAPARLGDRVPRPVVAVVAAHLGLALRGLIASMSGWASRHRDAVRHERVQRATSLVARRGRS